MDRIRTAHFIKIVDDNIYSLYKSKTKTYLVIDSLKRVNLYELYTDSDTDKFNPIQNYMSKRSNSKFEIGQGELWINGKICEERFHPIMIIDIKDVKAIALYLKYLI